MRLKDCRPSTADREPSGEPCLRRVQVDERRLLALDDPGDAERVQERAWPGCATRRPLDMPRTGRFDPRGKVVVGGTGDQHAPASPHLVGDGILDVLAD